MVCTTLLFHTNNLRVGPLGLQCGLTTMMRIGTVIVSTLSLFVDVVRNVVPHVRGARVRGLARGAAAGASAGVSIDGSRTAERKRNDPQSAQSSMKRVARGLKLSFRSVSAFRTFRGVVVYSSLLPRTVSGP